MTARVRTCRPAGSATRTDGLPSPHPHLADALDRAGEVLAAMSQRVVEGAIQDLEDGALVPLDAVGPSGARHYLAVSSDGSGTYCTSSRRCTCRAGQVGRMCRHRAAVLVVEAAA